MCNDSKTRELCKLSVNVTVHQCRRDGFYVGIRRKHEIPTDQEFGIMD